MPTLDPIMPLIRLLADGRPHSLQALAQACATSTELIEQHIYRLHDMGLAVVATAEQQFRLTTTLNLLDKDKIKTQMKQSTAVDCLIIPLISSTNQYLLDRVDQLQRPTLCLAEYQYQGRGRRGRPWFSPVACSLYFSLYWRFPGRTEILLGLSQALSLVVARTLRDLSGKEIKVKWPNDLYLNNKKLAGILVEMISRGEQEQHIVVGIGINLRVSVDNGAIDQPFANLGAIDRNLLAAKLTTSLVTLFEECAHSGLKEWLLDWHQFDTFYNQPVCLILATQQEIGINRGINDQGGLLLDQNGNITSYLSGTISLRAAKGS